MLVVDQTFALLCILVGFIFALHVHSYLKVSYVCHHAELSQGELMKLRENFLVVYFSILHGCAHRTKWIPYSPVCWVKPCNPPPPPPQLSLKGPSVPPNHFITPCIVSSPCPFSHRNPDFLVLQQSQTGREEASGRISMCFGPIWERLIGYWIPSILIALWSRDTCDLVSWLLQVGGSSSWL